MIKHGHTCYILVMPWSYLNVFLTYLYLSNGHTGHTGHTTFSIPQKQTGKFVGFLEHQNFCNKVGVATETGMTRN